MHAGLKLVVGYLNLSPNSETMFILDFYNDPRHGMNYFNYLWVTNIFIEGQVYS
jgi:hypothetical protein